jgi:flagellar motor switch protein FliG
MGKDEMPLEGITGARKAAALFVALGEDISSQLLKFLWEDEIERIGKEISALDTVPAEVVEKLLEEFHHGAVTGQYVSTGGMEYTKKLLQKALGSDGARAYIDRLTKTADSTINFAPLGETDPQQLYQFIQNEHPQTIALILAHVTPAHAAALLAAFPENVRADIAMRIANLGEIPPEVIKRISSILSQKISSLGTSSRESVGGARTVAELVNKMDRATAREILEKIEQQNPELAMAIRNLMLIFDDIMLVDPAGIREILQRADKKVLTLALKGTSEELQTHIFKNMSQRAAEMMKEDMEALGPVRLRDVEKAQHEMVEIVQKLEEEGLISLRGGSGDAYVV